MSVSQITLRVVAVTVEIGTMCRVEVCTNCHKIDLLIDARGGLDRT
jgi:hypothetical protein